MEQEQSVRRTERTWIARLVAKAPLEQIETETDYLLTIGSSEPAFLVFTNPARAGSVEPGLVAAMVRDAQEQRRAAFGIGRIGVLAFNNVWASSWHVERLVSLLIRLDDF